MVGRADQAPWVTEESKQMKNVVVVASDFDHDTWLEVQFDFVALPEGQELPGLARLAGFE